MEQMAVEGVSNLGSFVAKAGGIRFVTQQACGCRQSLQVLIINRSRRQSLSCELTAESSLTVTTRILVPGSRFLSS
jgi:hypothetical protein